MQERSSELVVIAEIHLAEHGMEEDPLESLLLLEQCCNDIATASVTTANIFTTLTVA